MAEPNNSECARFVHTGPCITAYERLYRALTGTLNDKSLVPSSVQDRRYDPFGFAAANSSEDHVAQRRSEQVALIKSLPAPALLTEAEAHDLLQEVRRGEYENLRPLHIGDATVGDFVDEVWAPR